MVYSINNILWNKQWFSSSNSTLKYDPEEEKRKKLEADKIKPKFNLFDFTKTTIPKQEFKPNIVKNQGMSSNIPKMPTYTNPVIGWVDFSNLWTKKPSILQQQSQLKTTPSPTFWIETANANNEKPVEKPSMNLFSDEVQFKADLLQEWYDEDFISKTLSNRRKDLLKNSKIDQEEAKALLQMQKDWLDTETAISTLKDFRKRKKQEAYDDLSFIWKVWKNIFDAWVWTISWWVRTVWGVLDYVSWWTSDIWKDALKGSDYAREVNPNSLAFKWWELFWQTAIETAWLRWLSKVPWLNTVWSKLWLTKLAPTLWWKVIQWAKVWAIYGGLQPIYEKWNEATAWDIWQSALIWWALGTALPITLNKWLKYWKALQKGWVTWLTKSINRDVTSVWSWIKQWFQKTFENKADVISTNINRMTKWKIQKFTEEIWVSPWKFLNDRWIFETWDDLVAKLSTNLKTSKKMADEWLSSVKWNFKAPKETIATDILDETTWTYKVVERDPVETMLKDNLTNASSKWMSKESLRNKILLEKYKKDWLSLSEINESKRFFNSNNKFNYYSDTINPRQEYVTTLDNKVRGWLFDTAEKNWFKNLKDINKQTKAYYKLWEWIGNWEDWIKWNNQLWLTDYLAFNADPSIFLAKQIAKNSTVKSWLIKWFNTLSWRKTQIQVEKPSLYSNIKDKPNDIPNSSSNSNMANTTILKKKDNPTIKPSEKWIIEDFKNIPTTWKKISDMTYDEALTFKKKWAEWKLTDNEYKEAYWNQWQEKKNVDIATKEHKWKNLEINEDWAQIISWEPNSRISITSVEWKWPEELKVIKHIHKTKDLWDWITRYDVTLTDNPNLPKTNITKIEKPKVDTEPKQDFNKTEVLPKDIKVWAKSWWYKNDRLYYWDEYTINNWEIIKWPNIKTKWWTTYKWDNFDKIYDNWAIENALKLAKEKWDTLRIKQFENLTNKSNKNDIDFAYRYLLDKNYNQEAKKSILKPLINNKTIENPNTKRYKEMLIEEKEWLARETKELDRVKEYFKQFPTKKVDNNLKWLEKDIKQRNLMIDHLNKLIEKDNSIIKPTSNKSAMINPWKIFEDFYKAWKYITNPTHIKELAQNIVKGMKVSLQYSKQAINDVIQHIKTYWPKAKDKLYEVVEKIAKYTWTKSNFINEWDSLFHWTKAKFDIFDDNKAVANWFLWKWHYFTPNKDYAKTYWRNIKETILNKWLKIYNSKADSSWQVFSELKNKFPWLDETNITQVLEKNWYNGIQYTDWDRWDIVNIFKSKDIPTKSPILKPKILKPSKEIDIQEFNKTIWDWKPTNWWYKINNIDITKTNAFPRSKYHKEDYVNTSWYKYWKEQIKKWKEITPIIVEKTDKWYYVLDWYHRLASAEDMWIKNIKAIVINNPIKKWSEAKGLKQFTKFSKDEIKQIYEQANKPKILKPVSKELEPLINEARKYKSVDEFIDAQLSWKSQEDILFLNKKYDEINKNITDLYKNKMTKQPTQEDYKVWNKLISDRDKIWWILWENTKLQNNKLQQKHQDKFTNKVKELYPDINREDLQDIINQQTIWKAYKEVEPIYNRDNLIKNKKELREFEKMQEKYWEWFIEPKVDKNWYSTYDDIVSRKVEAYARHKYTNYDSIISDLSEKESIWNKLYDEAKQQSRQLIKNDVYSVLERWQDNKSVQLKQIYEQAKKTN